MGDLDTGGDPDGKDFLMDSCAAESAAVRQAPDTSKSLYDITCVSSPWPPLIGSPSSSCLSWDDSAPLADSGSQHVCTVSAQPAPQQHDPARAAAHPYTAGVRPPWAAAPASPGNQQACGTPPLWSAAHMERHYYYPPRPGGAGTIAPPQTAPEEVPLVATACVASSNAQPSSKPLAHEELNSQRLLSDNRGPCAECAAEPAEPGCLPSRGAWEPAEPGCLPAAALIKEELVTHPAPHDAATNQRSGGTPARLRAAPAAAPRWPSETRQHAVPSPAARPAARVSSPFSRQSAMLPTSGPTGVLQAAPMWRVPPSMLLLLPHRSAQPMAPPPGADGSPGTSWCPHPPHACVLQHAHHCAAALTSAAGALQQITEDEVRRNVQRQVGVLIHCECDPTQRAWLNELLEVTKTTSLSVLVKIRLQLEVLMQELHTAAAAHGAPPMALHAGLDSWPGDAKSTTPRVFTDDGVANARPTAAVASASLVPPLFDQVDRRGIPLAAPPRCASGPSALAWPPPGLLLPQGAASVLLAQGAADARGNGGTMPPPLPYGHHSVCATGPPWCRAHSNAAAAAAAPPPSPCLLPTACLGPPGRKRGAAAAAAATTADARVDKRIKAESSSSATAGVGRCWRKTNNFTLMIDNIVQKMAREGCEPSAAPDLPSQLISTDVGGQAVLSGERVRQVYQFPLKEAATVLSVSMMSLKRTCRKMGVSRWPYRKLASLSELAVTVREDHLEQALSPSDKQAVLTYIAAAKAALVVDPSREMDPLLSELRKAKIHMTYEKWGRRSSRPDLNSDAQVHDDDETGAL